MAWCVCPCNTFKLKAGQVHNKHAIHWMDVNKHVSHNKFYNYLINIHIYASIFLEVGVYVSGGSKNLVTVQTNIK